MINIRKLATASIMTIGMVAGSAIAAQAFTPPPDCTGSLQVCIYKDANYVNQLGYRNVPFALQNISVANRNQLSSYANNSSSNAAWYSEVNGAGTCYNMPTKSKVDAYGLFDRDQAESWKSGAC